MTRLVGDLFTLGGRVALVTGGSRGLGLEIAHGLGEAGAKVVITARRAEQLEQGRRELLEAGIDVEAVVGDVGDSATVSAMVDTAVTRFGRLDILVNNAGATWGAPAEAMPIERFDGVLRTNVTGLFQVSQAAFPHLQASGHGCIINLASIAGMIGMRPEHLRIAGYSASKGAVIALTRQLAAEWASHHIRVNAIAPGFFPTRMAQAIIERNPAMVHGVPLGRHGRPGEIKGVAVFLASDAASFVTGVALPVDGGETAW